jgi:SAM-dependent MidA family methyltransferase
MELALFDLSVGYYTRSSPGPGARGDYVTSPELHAAFGGLLCLQLVEMWRGMGSPSPWWLVEAGPGTGTWMADVLRLAAEQFPELVGALRVVMIEPSPRLRDHQQRHLAPWAPRIRWESRVEELSAPLGPGVLFANEVLDALPFHRVVKRDDGLRELYVGLSDGELVEREGQPSTPALEAQLRDGGGWLKPGHRAEVCLAATEWVTRTVEVLEAGFLFLVDYGAPADQLYGAARPEGTLRCFDRHTLQGDPFANVGEQDITADVDFSAVTRTALEGGWELRGATSQASLLGRLGLSALRDWLETRQLGSPTLRAQRAALELLVDPDGLGRLLAVVYAKGTGAFSLAGFDQNAAQHPPEADAWWTPRA